MQLNKYTKLTCEPLDVAMGVPILASSVNNNSTVSSVGQEIGTDEDFEFDENAFVNSNWETGGAGGSI